MNCSSSPMERFFQPLQGDSSTSNVPTLVQHFADVFLAAGPQGAKSVSRNDFAHGLTKRKQLFESLGCQSTALVSVQETQLDARYVMARTQWQMTFARRERGPLNIFVDSVFIVDAGTDDFKIIFYLANQDIMLVLKDHGILPA